jgi:hypothetical protein
MVRSSGFIRNKLVMALMTISIAVGVSGLSPAASASPRPSVPWARVGPGWVLAQYWPGRFSYAGKAIAAPVTLYLISPAGHRYQLHRWAATKQPLDLLGWSGDKARALLGDPANGRLEQLTLATGRVSHISLPALVSPFLVGYTQPAGHGLLAIRQARAGTQLVRLGPTGRLVKVLASGPQVGTFVSSNSGATVAMGGARGLQLVSINGGVVRRLPVPRTAPSGCLPARWWNSRTILASCVARGAHRRRLWLVPASGARPTPLTPQRGGHSPDPGDVNAWTAPGGLNLQSLTSNGHMEIFRQRPHGTLLAVKPPGSAFDNWILAMHGARLLVSEIAPCQGTASLRWFSPATGRGLTLINAPRGRAGEIGAVPYGQPLADLTIAVGCGADRAAHIVHSPGATIIAPGL